MNRYCVFLVSTFLINNVFAFDDDRSLNFPDFNRENFLDITGYQYRKQLDNEWYAADNGLRISGGSLSQDELHTIMDFKFRTKLNSYSEFRASSVNETFYASKPVRHRVEFGVRPIHRLYFSLLGNPTYNKRSSDMGTAIEWGSRPLNYVRLAYTRHDLFFNDKNSLDDSFYKTPPIERNLQIVTAIGENVKIRLDLIQNDFFSQVLATDLLGNQGLFNYKGDKGNLVVDYHMMDNRILGISIKAFDFKKQHQTSVMNQQQHFNYLSVQVYHTFAIFYKAEITVTMRHDKLDYNTTDLLDSNKSAQRYFDTTQVNSSILQSYKPWLNIEYGLYLGRAKLQETLTGTTITSEGPENKFRFAVELVSDNRKNKLLFGTNWNLDNLSHKIWDGGQISFQGLF